MIVRRIGGGGPLSRDGGGLRFPATFRTRTLPGSQGSPTSPMPGTRHPGIREVSPFKLLQYLPSNIYRLEPTVRSSPDSAMVRAPHRGRWTAPAGRRGSETTDKPEPHPVRDAHRPPRCRAQDIPESGRFSRHSWNSPNTPGVRERLREADSLGYRIRKKPKQVQIAFDASRIRRRDTRRVGRRSD